MNTRAEAAAKSWLWVAVRDGLVETLRTLLVAGAEVDHVDDDGCTVLYMSAVYGHLEALRALLAAGAEVNHAANNDGVHSAAYSTSERPSGRPTCAGGGGGGGRTMQPTTGSLRCIQQSPPVPMYHLRDHLSTAIDQKHDERPLTRAGARAGAQAEHGAPHHTHLPSRAQACARSPPALAEANSHPPRPSQVATPRAGGAHAPPA